MGSARQKNLEIYLKTILPEGQLESVADDNEAPMRMTGAMPVRLTEAEKAQKAVKKLPAGKSLTDNDIFLIEAIIIPDKRPAVLVQDDAFDIRHEDWLHYNKGNISSALKRTIQAVGRIEVPDHPQIPYGGTGFVVGHDLVMTNRHVAEIFSVGLGRKGLKFKQGQTAGVDLKKEADRDTSTWLNVVDIVMVHPVWDMAILRVEGLPVSTPILTLSIMEPDSLVEREIAAIGYPAFDPRNAIDVQEKLFKGRYNVKRLQPGVLKNRRTIRHYGQTISASTHDASTLGGNSGSCIVDVSTGHVVGLHFGGRYQETNYAVPSWELSRDEYVVGSGVDFGEDGDNNIEDPNPSAEAWLAADAATEAASAGVVQTADKAASQASPRTVSVTVPVTITASIGSQISDPAVTGGTPAVPSSADIERMVEPSHDENYANKQGYDPEFLGVTVPLPKLTNDDDLSHLDDGGVVLNYTHFSLVMNKKRRLAQMTAANVDTNAARLKPDPSRRYDRRSLNGFTSEWDRERWFLDPRIPGNHQLPDRFFNKDRKAFDKGHIVRRNAIVWGDTYDEIQRANGDSFHATNCSPQVGGFNRSQLQGLWGRLENNVFKQAKTEKLCVLAGPIFSNDDPVFQGVDDDGAIAVKIPRAYWKVIVAVEDGALKVYAFRIEQDLSDVAFEFQVDAEWKQKQVKLKTLEGELKDTVFAKELHKGDEK